MSRLMILFLAFFLSACERVNQETPARPERPARIVSLDYCADQYVLKLVDRDRILALSPDAGREFSYMRAAAAGVPTVRPNAEDVLILKPDLVVRSYGGGPNAAAFFEKAGVPVVDIGWTPDIPSVMENTQRIADALGESERGAAVNEDMQERLAHLKKRSTGETALYMTPAGVTTGPGSLIHEMIVAAGLTNMEDQYGWRSLPLETLAYEKPDVVAAAFFGSRTNHPDAWSPMKHPVAKAQLTQSEVVSLEGAWTSCSGWFLMDAIEALAGGETQ
ncbi:ABC transporter substrate-binding protein [Hyphomonas sp.]|uniref:ABC transporter substrate-binding protein n=2 Tax=Hyphomonas sp. TaxID=87 RepID=UPI0030012A20